MPLNMSQDRTFTTRQTVRSTPLAEVVKLSGQSRHEGRRSIGFSPTQQIKLNGFLVKSFNTMNAVLKTTPPRILPKRTPLRSWSGLLLGMVLLVSGAMADDAGKNDGGRKSLEQRIAELEAKLKDAGAVGGVKGSGIKISGFIDTSYLVNHADRTETGPVAGSSGQNTGRVFDNQYDGFNLNAVWLTIQKDIDASKFPAGFRVDTIIGQDASSYRGLAANESTVLLGIAYIDLAIPVGNGIDVKIGKVGQSLTAYEAIPSPANWQFSRSTTFALEPWLQTGARFSYKWNDTITTTVGLVNGWDAASSSLNQNTDLAFEGRVDINGPKTSFGDFSAFVGGFYGNGDTTPTALGGTTTAALNRPTSYVITVGGTWLKPFDIKPLALGFEFLNRSTETAVAATGAAALAANVVNQIVPIGANSVSVYGKWDWNKWTSTSARGTYTAFQNNRATEVSGNPISLDGLAVQTGTAGRPSNTELFGFTLTQAFNVWKDTLVRLEWRHDWTPSDQVGFGTANAASHDDIRKDQDTLAVNVVYSF